VRLIKAYALVVAVVLAGVLAAASSGESKSSTTGTSPVVRLKTITSRATNAGTSLVIEASDPVPYVATRPDPLTLYIDFRNVSVEGLASFASKAGGPISNVAIEPGDPAVGGSPRVRVNLSQAVAHRVRADRNTVVIDFDKATAKGAPYVMPPPSASKPAAVVTTTSTQSNSPEAMQALVMSNRSAVDPIAALGLNAPKPRAQIGPGQSQAQPVPPAGDQNPAQPATSVSRRFTGNPVSLDFQGADLRAVLRTFSEISSLNIVIDPSVNGSVDVALKDVPWDQALDIILRANKLGYTVDGTIVRIAPLTVLAEEATQQQKLEEAKALSGELRPFTKTLSYAKAEDLQALLTKSVLSARGTVQVDPRTNTLIITDLPDRVVNASDLISALDKAQPQVEIEARIVQVNKNFQRTLGVQWGFSGRVDPALGNTTNLAFPNNGTLSGAQGGTTGGLPTAVNLPVPGAPSAVGLQLIGERRLQPRRRAVRARNTGQRPRALDAARIDAEQRRGGNQTGHADSDSDGRQ